MGNNETPGHVSGARTESLSLFQIISLKFFDQIHLGLSKRQYPLKRTWRIFIAVNEQGMHQIINNADMINLHLVSENSHVDQQD